MRAPILAACGRAAVLALSLAACSTTPPPAPVAALTTASPEAMVAAIRAAAAGDSSEFAVQPLRDPMVEDLREQAMRLERLRHYGEAAAALDKALAIAPQDPALLQERAEAALLMRDGATAERLARQAYSIGARVGPLCRRHWVTVQQTRLLAGDASGATAALEQAGLCTLAAPNRF